MTSLWSVGIQPICILLVYYLSTISSLRVETHHPSFPIRSVTSFHCPWVCSHGCPYPFSFPRPLLYTAPNCHHFLTTQSPPTGPPQTPGHLITLAFFPVLSDDGIAATLQVNTLTVPWGIPLSGPTVISVWLFIKMCWLMRFLVCGCKPLI